MSLMQKREALRSRLYNKTQFDILNEFETLDPQRKMVLCDQLLHNGVTTYKNTVKLLWPAANSNDAVRLEKFLRARMKR